MRKTYSLAPMSPLILGLTSFLFLLPIFFFVVAFLAPSTFAWIPLSLGAVFVASYLFIWIWLRPTRFDLDDFEFRISWPLRVRTYSRSQIENVELVTGSEFQKRYGNGIRFGAGGLWGGFGMLLTKGQNFDLYVSRTDEFVLISFKTQRPLLITPENSKEFVMNLSVNHA